MLAEDESKVRKVEISARAYREIYPLTDRQRDVLNAIDELSKKGQAPSLVELAASVGMRSTWAIRRHLSVLERKGFVKPRGHRQMRAIALAEPIAA